MDKRIRKFYYNVAALKGESFRMESYPAANFSEVLEKAIDRGVWEEIPDEIHIKRLPSFIMEEV